MKRILLLALSIAALALPARADSTVIVLTAGVSSNIFSVGKIIDNITATATSTNITTLKFYDSSSTTTTYVQAAYSRYASYQTNFTVVFTNEADLLITNSYTGLYTYPTSVSATTSAIPVIQTIVVPASGQRSKDITIQTMRGLTVVPNQDAIVEVTYRNNP